VIASLSTAYDNAWSNGNGGTGTASGFYVPTRVVTTDYTVTITYTWMMPNSGTLPVEPVLDRARALLKRKRRLSRAARIEATLVARRYPRRVVTRPRQTELFCRRTCSMASRWRVLQ